MLTNLVLLQFSGLESLSRQLTLHFFVLCKSKWLEKKRSPFFQYWEHWPTSRLLTPIQYLTLSVQLCPFIKIVSYYSVLLVDSHNLLKIHSKIFFHCDLITVSLINQNLSPDWNNCCWLIIIVELWHQFTAINNYIQFYNYNLFCRWVYL